MTARGAAGNTPQLAHSSHFGQDRLPTGKNARTRHGRPRIAGRPVLILRNHGLLAWGETLPQALAHL
jgi:ribulose-5-phosphate 4-epimerase/fuculose-1-phosphate aldolase